MQYPRQDSNNPQNPRGKVPIDGQRGTESGTVSDGSSELAPVTIAPDLAAVVDAWDRLPDAIRAGILAMVKAAT